ncbi:SAICAR synthase-like protein [Eremomyces bilateralis CBS 781.70]|uniref:Kinase n=1 Tax=Eremomyces bilateralis CBS 781.70 TaxID=1392243 RepID=A0A6G1FWY6_9PEZI|nr:SAICAR synthase-like protein [Eremomyces bilateralis CBS 781.70]KAF1810357.1 SAICAR synthase-like protein [Eremomyces bilateralis CBS 781.70]
MTAQIDPASLKAFGDVAAGHDGVLSDESGGLVIKPCTAKEIAFYEAAPKQSPDFAKYIPTYMGTLQLNKPAEATDPTTSSSTAPDPTATTAAGTAATLSLDEAGPMFGKALTTETSIVLENVAARFRKPNILDLKLGAQLWDDAAKPEKRARLDKVSAETTSGSLGFRVAGMRVYGARGDAPEHKASDYMSMDSVTGYRVYNKMYGRVFNADNVNEAFKEYVTAPGVTAAHAKKVFGILEEDVKGIEAALMGMECRMYSASILFVYEGDVEGYEKAVKDYEANPPAQSDDDDDEEEDTFPRLTAVKLIDFAHASFVPRQGPDENALQGVRSVGKILHDLQAA